MATGKSNITQAVQHCPACRTEIHATFSTDITMDLIHLNGDATSVASVVVTGMRISHDCIPQSKRSAESQAWESYGR